VTGQVIDSSKAIIAGAHILAVNVNTNIRYEAATNGAGEYYFPNLLPGSYRMEANMTGFKAVMKPYVVLHVQDAVEINFELAIGSASESVTVEGGEPLVQLATSDLGAVVESRTIRELPLNGRSWTDLATLQPGVVAVETQGVLLRGCRPRQSRLRFSVEHLRRTCSAEQLPHRWSQCERLQQRRARKRPRRHSGR
jgi:hypothetical protein